MPHGDVTVCWDGSWSVSVYGDKDDNIMETVQELIKTNQAAWAADSKEGSQ